MSVKTLTVATELQKAVFENVLANEIAAGFWKVSRPADHADAWKGVNVVVGTELGACGFEVPRNYNFVNPDFFKATEAQLLEAAKTVNPDVTVKQLKKQLISLNQIIGARLKEIGGTVTKLNRGKKAATAEAPVTSEKKSTKSTVKKVAANIVTEAA